MRDFGRNEEGYALVLTLMFMPVFIGLSLMIIDLGRGNNAHSDLYAAADALALAGAAELDGSSIAIPNAKAAMEELTNSVSFLGLGDGEGTIDLNYDRDDADNEFNVIFLKAIPVNDETPINQAWIDDNGTVSSFDAKYVYVAARSSDLDTIFPLPVSFVRQSVPIQASAVAGRNASACKITPVFICNPFDGSLTHTLQTGFDAGMLHGRLIQLHPSSNSDRAGPGNFGFLSLNGNPSNADLRNYFSGFGQDACIEADGDVDTAPGARTSIRDAMNVRFDIFRAGYKEDGYVTAKNVRKGFEFSEGVCSGTLIEDYDTQTLEDEIPDPDAAPDSGDMISVYGTSTYTGFPNNVVMAAPGTANAADGATFGEGGWPIDEYLLRNHGKNLETLETDEGAITNRFPAAQFPGTSSPSRYEVYRYEIEKGLVAGSGAGSENGNPLCSTTTTDAPAPVDNPDRRLIQAAIINCEDYVIQGYTDDVPIVGYASVFLARPWVKDSGTIDVEIVDITGAGGLGSLDNYIRVESILVR